MGMAANDVFRLVRAWQDIPISNSGDQPWELGVTIDGSSAFVGPNSITVGGLCMTSCVGTVEIAYSGIEGVYRTKSSRCQYSDTRR
jgi:hypothetical protein